MSEVIHNRIVRKAADVVTRRVAGETLLVPIRARLADMERLFFLEGVGEFVWERLDGKRTEAELAAEVTRTYEVEGAQAVADVRAFLDRLVAAGLAV